MAIGAFVPLVFFIVILGTVGVRLVRLWWRTRRLPELSLGAGLLILSGSMPPMAIGRMPATAMEPVGRACFAIALLAMACGLSLMVFFTYWVFRRESRWARALLVLLSSLLFGAALYMGAANLRGESVTAIKQEMRPGTLTLMGAILSCFLWGGLESFQRYGALVRRMALGLGDPVLANRFLLWGVASVTCAALVAVLVVCVFAGMTIAREPVAMATIAGAGTIMSASWYLTFFTPGRYRRFITARAARAH